MVDILFKPEDKVKSKEEKKHCKESFSLHISNSFCMRILMLYGVQSNFLKITYFSCAESSLLYGLYSSCG